MSVILSNVLLAGLSVVLAPQLREESAVKRRDGDAGAVRAEKHVGGLDRYFISCLRLGNQGEVTLAKLAEQRSQHPEVKSFAKEMVKSHTEILATLGKLDGTQPTDRTGKNDRDSKTDAAAPERRESPAPGARPDSVNAAANVPASADGLAGVIEEVARECLANAERELSQKEGAEFDKAFMGMQVAGHLKMKAELTVFAKHASPQLRTVLAKGLEVTEQHLAHATKICSTLDSGRTDKALRDKDAAK